MSSETRLLKPSQVAEKLQISKRQVWRMIRAKVLPAENINLPANDAKKHRPTYRVDPSAVEQFRQQRQCIPEAVIEKHRRVKAVPGVKVIQFYQ